MGVVKLPSISWAWNSSNAFPKCSFPNISSGSCGRNSHIAGFGLLHSSDDVDDICLPCVTLCLISQFHLFFTLIADLPLRYFDMEVHLLPKSLCNSSKSLSSISDHVVLDTCGDSCPIQRSRHCLPVRPGTIWHILIQLSVPNTSTAWTRSLSSSDVHLAFLSLRFSLRRDEACILKIETTRKVCYPCSNLKNKNRRFPTRIGCKARKTGEKQEKTSASR